jgi:hypothetical protein
LIGWRIAEDARRKTVGHTCLGESIGEYNVVFGEGVSERLRRERILDGYAIFRGKESFIDKKSEEIHY